MDENSSKVRFPGIVSVTPMFLNSPKSKFLRERLKTDTVTTVSGTLGRRVDSRRAGQTRRLECSH